jgi:molybdopterin/thiamine biosynthesis adenylyltransferase
MMLNTNPIDLEFERRFGALVRLYGATGAQRIFSAHVVVVGIGGVGSWAVESLARSGVQRLTLIDMDHISVSNVNRQLHALSGTIGQSKVLAMQSRILEINPRCIVTVVDDFVTPENWSQMAAQLSHPIDGLIDACDQTLAKVALCEWAVPTQTRLISVGAAGGKMAAHRVDVKDLIEVTHDPLMAQVRYRLRRSGVLGKESKKSGIHCVFSTEKVINPWGKEEEPSGHQDSSLNCHGYGSSVSVTATFGHCAAGWILHEIAHAQV